MEHISDTPEERAVISRPEDEDPKQVEARHFTEREFIFLEYLYKKAKRYNGWISPEDTTGSIIKPILHDMHSELVFRQDTLSSIARQLSFEGFVVIKKRTERMTSPIVNILLTREGEEAFLQAIKTEVVGVLDNQTIRDLTVSAQELGYTKNLKDEELLEVVVYLQQEIEMVEARLEVLAGADPHDAEPYGVTKNELAAKIALLRAALEMTPDPEASCLEILAELTSRLNILVAQYESKAKAKKRKHFMNAVLGKF